MIGRYLAFLLLDLFIHTCANPDVYQDFYRPNRGAQNYANQWHQDWSSWNQQDWWHTTQRVRRRPTERTGDQSAKTSSPSTPEPTSPQAVIKAEKDNSEDSAAIKSDFNTAAAGDLSIALASNFKAAIDEIGPAVGHSSTVKTSDVSAAKSGDTSAVATSATGHVNLETASDVKAAAGDFNSAISDVDATTESDTVTEAGEVSEPQWHVGIYKTTTMPYTQICGGSLIKTDVVLSAGHCFWTNETNQLPTEQFAAAAGKRYRAWDDPRDLNAQYSKIKDIVISPMYQPCYSPDLAVLSLATPFTYGVAVKPACLDFHQLKKLPLRKGNVGLIAGWGVVAQGCAASQLLKWSALPFVPRPECSSNMVVNYEEVVDRFCAGDGKDRTQCETDSGSGLVFLDKNTPYLRGVATFASEDKLCYIFNTTSFTKLELARIFLLANIPSSRECQEFYGISESPMDVKLEAQSQFQNDGQDSTQFDNEGALNTFAEERNADEQTFFASGTGSLPVPAIANTSAPSYQWHVGVYSKTWKWTLQICGGSLVKRDVIISAAHCFWEDATGQQPESQFAVAGGKLYRRWDEARDAYAQWSNVSRIVLPSRFRGAATSFQDDIAIVRLTSPFTYALGVQPACVDFGIQLERRQLVKGNPGTVAGWGLTEKNGRPSQRLNYLQLPYVDIDECISSSESSFLKYITSDKICAGDQRTGKALCRGDSGGGLIFFSGTSPYLRGVASTAASNDNFCNEFAIATFTQLHAHRTFLRDNIPDVDKECKKQDSATGNRVDTATGNGGGKATGRDKVKIPTGIDATRGEFVTGGDRRMDITTENADKRVDVTTGMPFISNYQPPVQYGIPGNHFYCNCNCKS